MISRTWRRDLSAALLLAALASPAVAQDSAAAAGRLETAAHRFVPRVAQQSRLQDLRTQIELEVRQAWLDVREARSRVTAAGEAVAQADENLRMSRELYGSGLGTNTQVLDAITLQVTAANNRDNAALDEVLARYRLSYAAGKL